jgi:hypothetical protein
MNAQRFGERRSTICPDHIPEISMLQAKQPYTTVFTWRLTNDANRDISGVTGDQFQATHNLLDAFKLMPGVPLQGELRIAGVDPREVAVTYRRTHLLIRVRRDMTTGAIICAPQPGFAAPTPASPHEGVSPQTVPGPPAWRRARPAGGASSEAVAS